MKTNTFKNMILFASTAALLGPVGLLSAGVPLTNLEGAAGAAFNPFAYTANPGTSLFDPNTTLGKAIGKPQIGAWYVNLGDVDVDWTALGISQTFFGKLELSYGHEIIAPDGLENIKKDNVGAKLLLIEENAWDQAWFPAISVGVIGKHTQDNPYDSLPGVNSSGYDIYAVATKLITQTPVPTLISGGVMSTDSRTTGVFGYDDDRDLTAFGNVDFVLTKQLALGFEYKQGADYDNWRDADYWDLHAAWFVNPSTTLLAAYVNAGDEDSSSKVGLGDGLVLSLQYAF